jgi:hypothetical protein
VRDLYFATKPGGWKRTINRRWQSVLFTFCLAPQSMGWTPTMIETNLVGSEDGETMTRQQIGRALYALANRGLVVKERDGYHLTDAGIDALPE